MGDLYLYHATDRKNLYSILDKGLLAFPSFHNWNGMYMDDGIFLAVDATVAEDYVDASDNPPDDVVVLKVSLSSLDDNFFVYDWNNLCEYHTDINSVVYTKDIKPELLSVCEVDLEPFQDIESFRLTEMYDKVMETFYQQVETNKEKYDVSEISFLEDYKETVKKLQEEAKDKGFSSSQVGEEVKLDK